MLSFIERSFGFAVIKGRDDFLVDVRLDGGARLTHASRQALPQALSRVARDHIYALRPRHLLSGDQILGQIFGKSGDQLKKALRERQKASHKSFVSLSGDRGTR